jgi:hypothetical protein
MWRLAQTASGGVCVVNEEVNFDILKVESPAENRLDIETGGTVAGDGVIGASVEQIMFLFASTDPTAVTANNNLIHPQQLGQILNPIIIKQRPAGCRVPVRRHDPWRIACVTGMD